MTRKQREVREREQLLLQIARKMLIEHGYAGLSMDQLAEAAEYSKGTIYQHFESKEDLVTALAIESMERRVELFLRAEQFAGRPRERMLAIGVADELFSRLEIQHYHSEFIIKLANLRDRASTERQQALEKLENSCFGCVVRIVESGIESGDLPRDTNPRELVYSVFTMALGTHMTSLHFCSMLIEFRIDDPQKVLLQGIHVLLDGSDWRPKRVEWDFAKTYQRIQDEVFSEEFKSLAVPK